MEGSSHLSLVYDDKKNEEESKEDKQKRLQLEKEKLKEVKARQKSQAKEKQPEDKPKKRQAEDTPKTVTLTHRYYNPVAEQEDDPETPSYSQSTTLRQGESLDDEPKKKKKGGCGLSPCLIACLVLGFLTAVVISFLLSYEFTMRLMGTEAFVEEAKDGIVHFGQLNKFKANDEEVENTEDGRLPRNIMPLWYNITIKTYFPGFVEIPAGKNFTFEGLLKAKFAVVDETNTVVLHTRQLRLPGAEGWIVTTDDEGDFNVTTVEENKANETVTLTLGTPLTVNSTFYITVNYTAKIQKSTQGVYRTSYTNDKGEKRYLIATQGEATFARMILPCIDEPDRKAVFKVTVIHPNGTTALSNGLENPPTQSEDPSFVTTTFSETPKMSTYLLAFTVSDFAHKELKTERGVLIRAWVQSDLADLLEFPLKVAVDAVDYYEDIYNTSYPLEKMDLFASPTFSMGAMENWGLLVFHENVMLYNPKVSSLAKKRTTVQLIYHEIAHQWFGNLVTMKWWNDLWLNEAFASCAEFTAPDRKGTLKGSRDAHYIHNHRRGFIADSYINSHPITSSVSDPAKISQLFDDVTYQKGASLVCQLESVVGIENYNKGLAKYFAKYAYGNAAQDDLIQVLASVLPSNMTEVSKELRRMMRRYTKQPGFPVVTITRPDTAHVEMTQAKYRKDRSTPDVKNIYHNLWDVPLFYSINDEKQPVTFLKTGVRIPVNHTDLLLVNSEAEGFYLVNYDRIGWEKIVEELNTNHTNFSPIARNKFILDSFLLAEAGLLPYEVAFDTISYLSEEEHPTPILTATYQLENLNNLVMDEKESQSIHKLIRDKLGPFVHRNLNWDDVAGGDDVIMSEAVMKCAELLVRAGDAQIIDRIRTLFRKNFIEPCSVQGAISSVCSKVPSSIRQVTYNEGMRAGIAADFELIVQLFRREVQAAESRNLIVAMKGTQDSYALNRLFHTLLDEEGEGINHGNNVDEFAVLASSRNALSRRVFNEFFYDNQAQLFDKFNASDYVTISRVTESLTPLSSSDLAELEGYMKEHPDRTKQFDGFGKSVDTARSLLRWRRRYLPHIVEVLEKADNRVF